MFLRQMEIVTDADKLKVEIEDTCSKYKSIKQWAYILHDKDETRPHYHIYLNFGNSSIDTAVVAGWFEIAENFIERVKGRKADALLYLTHANSKDKHQYSIDDVKASWDIVTEMKIAKVLGDFENYSYAEQLKYVNTLPVQEKSAAYTRLKKLWELECQCLTLNAEREVFVLFICGKAGTGKTYYAKRLLEGLKYDYCMSSSSNDPFQDYLGQKAIILDDLRYTDFELSDLLKILDNNTGSSVRSRFTNKVFNGKMIIITSSVPLKFWYPSYRYETNDSLMQLYRRINAYVEVGEKDLTVYKKLDEMGNPTGLGAVYVNEVYEIKRSKREKQIDIEKAFDEICTPGGDFPF